MVATPHTELKMDKLNAFIGRFVTDLGAVHAGMVVIGEKLGLYKALAHGPMSSAELAKRTQTDERYVREWLALQASGGYVTYDDATNTFSLSAEQALALAKEDINPVGRVYYSFSTLLCTPCARSQEAGLCLGAQAGEPRMRQVARSAGFHRFRRAAQTPFNIVYEIRP